MGIFKTKGGYKVKSYITDKFHKNNKGGIKIYKTRADAMKAAGNVAKHKMKRRKK